MIPNDDAGTNRYDEELLRTQNQLDDAGDDEDGEDHPRVCLSEMAVDDDGGNAEGPSKEYKWKCRCGDVFVLGEDEVPANEGDSVLIPCQSCSIALSVQK